MKEKKGGAGVKIVKGVLAGAIAGIMAGVLLAPKKGKETRKDIKENIDKLGKEIVNKAGEVEKLTKEKYSNVVDEASDLFQKAKKIKKEDLKKIKKKLKGKWPEISEKLKKNPIRKTIKKTKKTDKVKKI